jgi:hypothetical protein
VKLAVPSVSPELIAPFTVLLKKRLLSTKAKPER